MSQRRRASLAAVTLVLVVLVGWIVLSRQRDVPTASMTRPPNEIDIDLALGTPLPPLPTPQPDGMSILTAEQALSRGLQGMFFRPKPESISVRLLNHGVMNRLCGGSGGSMPEDALVWAVAFTQAGLTMKDVNGFFYDRQPPPISLTSDPPQPTPTVRLTPTPEMVAGAISVLVAGEGYLNYQEGLFDPNSSGTRCPTFDMIRAMRSFPDTITPEPTEHHEPANTMSIDDLFRDGITATNGISLPQMMVPMDAESRTSIRTPTP